MVEETTKQTYTFTRREDHDTAPSKKITPEATKPKESRLSVILLGQGFFMLYERLFIVCLSLNINGLVLAASAKPSYALCSGSQLTFLVILGLAAFPVVRHLHHNVFERTHRFTGLASLILLWAFIVLTKSYEPETMSYNKNVGSRLIKKQEFWLTLIITVLIILPWVTVRRVVVKVSVPSRYASIIKFAGGIKPGILDRISPSPLSEWHTFGIICDCKEEHMMLPGAVGDFTNSLVSNPPSHLWQGPAEVCLLWVAKGNEQNIRKEIKEWVSNHPKEKVIVHDTSVMGWPNLSEISVEAARK
nr:zinc finger, CCHC-type [Tanacetum cinerariifolium]